MNDDNMKRMVDLTYADDGNILGRTPRPQEIEGKAVKKLAKWKVSMTKHGFDTSWKKSAALLQIRGRGSRQVRKNIRSKGDRLFVSLKDEENIGIKDAQKSLGAMISSNGSMNA